MHKSGNSFLKSVKFENDGVNKIIYEIPDLNRSGQIAVIFNPVSGKKKSSGNQNQILRDLKSSIPDCIIHDSINQEETKEFINSALEEGINFFVVAGGDGTVNTVASELIQTNATLGIIPTGSGNGLARHLGIPLNLKGALDTLKCKNLKKIDCGYMNEIPFFCTAGVGFDAEVAQEFSRKKQRGYQAYLEVILKEYWKFKPQDYKVRFGKQSIKARSFLISFANAAQYGNNAFISPNAKIDDGLLDMCLISEFPQIKAPIMGLKVLTKIINTSNHYEMIRIKEALVIRNKAGWAHFDGEPVFMPERLKFRILPGVLEVCAGPNL